MYFITWIVASQDIQRVVDKKTNEASAGGEFFSAFLELFTNEFNLVEKPPHARDFRSSILELYNNQSIRERTKYTLRCHENRKITLPYFILLIQN